MSEYKIIGYRRFVGSDGSDNEEIRGFYNTEKEAIGEAKFLMRRGVFFHTKIVKIVREYRAESKPADVSIKEWKR